MSTPRATPSVEAGRGLAVKGKFVGLRPIWPEDAPLVFDWWSNKDELPLWTSQFRQVTTYQQFLSQLDAWLRDSTTFMLIDLSNAAPFGFVRAYNLNLADGWVWWQAYVEPGYRARGRMAEWAALVGRYLFEQFPIRKLCAEIFEFNDAVRNLHEKLGFRLEGRIKDHTWYRDRFWDHLFYTLTREAWGEAMKRYDFITGAERELAAQFEMASVNGFAQEV